MRLAVNGKIIATRVKIADTFLTRLKGFLGRDSITHEEVLIIKPCNSVHTCFMKFPIDVIFIDGDGKILSMKKNMKPFRIKITPGAASVIELHPGVIDENLITVGSMVELI